MGELKNCPVCGKVFVKVVRNLCPECVEAEEREFTEVRDYIKDRPGASVDEIVNVTGIEEKKILRWMREGRIEYSVKGQIGLTCHSCGAPITIGEICNKCSKELSGRLNSISKGMFGAPKTESTNQDAKSRRMYGAYGTRKDD